MRRQMRRNTGEEQDRDQGAKGGSGGLQHGVFLGVRVQDSKPRTPSLSPLTRLLPMICLIGRKTCWAPVSQIGTPGDEFREANAGVPAPWGLVP